MMSLTVGICAYNEEWNIGSLLDNILAEQSLPKDAEVIVVCSGQTDNTAKIVSKISKKDSRVHLIQELTRRGKASAVNSILSKARGQNIIFVSADVMPRHGCFTELVRTVVADGGIGIACGGAVPVERGGLLLRTIVDTLWSLHNHQLKWQSDAGTLTHATDVFCIRNGIIDKIPPDTINDDSYIAVKTKALGYAIRFVPMSTVALLGPQTVCEYLLQRRRIIVGHYQIRKATGRITYPPLSYWLMIRPRSTLKMIVKYLASRRGPMGVILMYPLEATANLLAFADILRKKSYVKWPIVPSTKSRGAL